MSNLAELPEIADGVLISEEDIRAKVVELGAMISRDYEGRDLRLITVLRGGVFFLADLSRAISIDHQIDFMAVSSFLQGGPGAVRITKDLDDSIADSAVLVVEDIIDTGLTLNYVLTMLRERKPASLEVCALLDKDVRRIVDPQVSYCGFPIPDRFVIGYGLDLGGRYRNLPFIATVPVEAV